jgi:predicted dehydrogenase
MEQGFAMLDLALWLADFPAPVRVSAHMERGRGASAVEDSMLAFVECEQGKTIVIDVSWNVTAQEDRWWFDVLATRGSAQLSPFKVVKALNGVPADVTPRGAAVRESAVTQSYRAELAHFLAVVREETGYESPTDQIVVHRIAEAIYKSADEEKEISL